MQNTEERVNIKLNKEDIPKETVARLPIYLRCLNRLIIKGHATLSSKELADSISLSSAKIRKDLSYFGKFGTRGVGYELKPLVARIRHILNLDQTWRIALVGIGKVGTALLSYPGFNRGCFQIELLFDDDPELIGTEVGGRRVLSSQDIPRLVKERGIQIGVIAVPDEKVLSVAEGLIEGGVKGIINFAPVAIDPNQEVLVYQIDISTELSRLTYHLSS